MVVFLVDTLASHFQVSKSAIVWSATSFKPVTNAEGGIGFDIGFNTEDEASLFESDFA